MLKIILIKYCWSTSRINNTLSSRFIYWLGQVLELIFVDLYCLCLRDRLVLSDIVYKYPRKCWFNFKLIYWLHQNNRSNSLKFVVWPFNYLQGKLLLIPSYLTWIWPHYTKYEWITVAMNSWMRSAFPASAVIYEITNSGLYRLSADCGRMWPNC